MANIIEVAQKYVHYKSGTRVTTLLKLYRRKDKNTYTLQKCHKSKNTLEVKNIDVTNRTKMTQKCIHSVKVTQIHCMSHVDVR